MLKNNFNELNSDENLDNNVAKNISEKLLNEGTQTTSKTKIKDSLKNLSEQEKYEYFEKIRNMQNSDLGINTAQKISEKFIKQSEKSDETDLTK